MEVVKVKLSEIAPSYRESAQLLDGRIRQLKSALSQTRDPLERCRLESRIEVLTVMYRETRAVAVVCERYYERGYCRDAKYKI